MDSHDIASDWFNDEWLKNYEKELEYERQRNSKPPDTPFLDAILGRRDLPPWDPSKHRRLVDNLWGTPMLPSNRNGPVKAFTSPVEVAEFHADVEAWMKENTR